LKKLSDFEAYTPNEIAERVESVGVTKANLATVPMIALGMLAGAFIGLGALYFVVVVSDPTLGFATSRVLGGLVFSLGLVLVIVAGAELFTGNNLLALGWVDGRISTRALLRNWIIVCAANFAGGLGLAMLVCWSGHPDMNGGLVAREYVVIAASKVALPFGRAFFLAVLCNSLVCLAVWMALAGRSVIDKAIAVVLPISAFVAAGFEHSVANMYLIPMGLLLRAEVDGAVVPHVELLTWARYARSLVPVILGNIVGGSVLVGFVYYVIYRRGSSSRVPRATASSGTKDAGTG
jgi:formate transporter